MQRGRLLPFVVGAATLWAGCGDGGDTEIPDDPRSGGSTTVFDTTRQSFTLPAANLKGDRRDQFFLGNAVFNRGWVIAPASVEDFDGLGPFFNATGCSGCHLKDGRGRPPVKENERFTSLLIRLSVPGVGAHGEPVPEPVYGGQLQGEANPGVPKEGRARIDYTELPGAYPDGGTYSLRRPTYVVDDLGYGPMAPDVMMSPRTAPAMIGLGLLEAITDATLLSFADPSDRDGDGISGRPNHVWDPERNATVIGRFGWKANEPSLLRQNAGAFSGDLGITSTLLPAEGCTSAQKECAAQMTGPGPQLRPSLLEDVVFYSKTIAVPARRDVADPTVRRGRALFDEARCGSCHVARVETGALEGFPELSHQKIQPFTDLLLHDMGPELADGRPDFEASGSEWRTPPLWGIGLVEKVSDHELFLHDGRARGFEEAILWHGGEGARSRESFRAMSKADRDAIVRFLRSL